MNSRRTIVGLCMLCALVVCALAAQGANASKGTTAFTCKKAATEGAGFKKAHCTPNDAVGSKAEFQHVAIAEGTTTEISGTNSNTSSNTEQSTTVQLKHPVTGINYEIQAGKVSGLGSVTNAVDPVTKEHYVHGTFVVTFEEIVITQPGGGVCSISGGSIKSVEMTATTKGQGDFVLFQPKEGSQLTEYTIVGASCPEAIKGTYKTTGSVKCPLEGATVVCSHNATTELGTLINRGGVTGIEGKMTLSAREFKEEALTATSVTTVETP